MNYLSHFAVDQRSGNHEFNTGLILPDIAKKWINRLRAGNISSDDDPLQQQIAEGCMAHLEADRKFHTSSFFSGFSHKAGSYISNAGMSLSVNRKWFIAHVAVELLIDRAIVSNEPGTVDAFYHSLNSVDEKSLTSFLRMNGMQRPHEFFVFFDHFRKVQYIRYYTDNNKLLYSLGRIMLRAGLPELSADDQYKLLKALLIFEQNEMADPQEMTRKLKNIFE